MEAEERDWKVETTRKDSELSVASALQAPFKISSSTWTKRTDNMGGKGFPPPRSVWGVGVMERVLRSPAKFRMSGSSDFIQYNILQSQ